MHVKAVAIDRYGRNLPRGACKKSEIMVDAHSPMHEVVAGLKRADCAACHEFCRRQKAELLEPLAAGAERLGRIAFELECRQPETLLAWRFPHTYEPFELLPAALDAACEGREDDVYALLADVSFSALAATASTCSHIKLSVRQIKRYRRRQENLP